MDHFDAIVIGARCGGSATARLLAAAGARVLLVDRATFPSDTQSTHAVAWHGTRLLQHWGVFERLRALGTPNPREMTVRLGDITLERLAAEPETPGGFAPRRTVIDAVLVDAAGAAGAVLWDSTTCEDLRWAGGRVTGAVVRRGGRTIEVSADLVIGADGAHSRVAGLVGATAYNVLPSDMAGAYAYYADMPVDVPHLLLADRRIVLAFVTNHAQVCLVVGAPSAEAAMLLPPTDGVFRTEVATIAPGLAAGMVGARRVSRFNVFRPQPSVMRVPHGPGWALVGDAGHYMDPTTGQGMANAFLSAQLLADAVIAGEDLAAYQSRRDELLGEMHTLTGALSQLAWSNDEVLGLFGRFRAAVGATLAAVDARLAAVSTAL